MLLNKNELLEIKGGAKTGAAAIVLLIFGGFMTIIAGIFDGLSNPTKCNN